MKVVESQTGTGLEWPEHIARVAVSGDELWRLDQRADTMLAVRREDECGTDLGNGQVVLVATRETWRRVADELDCWIIANGRREPGKRALTRSWCEVIRRGVLGEGVSGS